ncbi:NADH-quinone oxidoreductase subunit J [Dermatobacter hominis]|uniref:NADH-quinone oxidoreductase subunit J n=1 Tax=Dermatobacter hominis TaxID=2884263 RepID=UPI001D11788C|nr:NADH-quinone oxidoreductase subunit J [Dermatobacter hominis]UDY33972.1 NADH-quinone oxidoreductase subunit J [Dermatobacter hominis]
MRVEMFTFLIAAAIVLGGALGVVLFRNPVHNALSLVATLFGIAVLFIAQEAYFLAAIQVIVYAGAIVVLFLFVIMLLGVDRVEATEHDPLPAQRIVGVIAGLGILVLSIVILLAGGDGATGERSATAPLSESSSDIERLGRVLFTDYVFAFEVTAVLLTVAVVGAVVLSRRPKGEPIDTDEFPDGPAVEHLELFPEPAGPGAVDGEVSIGSDDGPMGESGDADADGAELAGGSGARTGADAEVNG